MRPAPPRINQFFPVLSTSGTNRARTLAVGPLARIGSIMSRKMLLSFAFGAAATLAIPQAQAAPILWDFSVGTVGLRGTTEVQNSVPGSIPVTLSGFTGAGVATALFRKADGGDENGMGLN